MDKAEILKKIKSGDYNQEKLIGWITALPGTNAQRKPSEYKVGDVLMSNVFKHPYVLLKKKSNGWIAGLLTSEDNCPEILEKCNSRFFSENFITKALFTVTEIQGSFINNFDNNKQLKEVYNKLKDIL